MRSPTDPTCSAVLPSGMRYHDAAHSRVPWLGLILRAGCVVLAGAWGTASAATYAVGSGAGCTHGTVQAALSAAASNASGPHLIKLSTGTLAVPNGLTLHGPQADITLEGGYASCSAAAATAGQRTTLNATGGNDGTVLDIRSNSFRSVRLSRLVITGGTGETGIFASSEGGGLELRGDLDVFLDQGTQVSGNRANRAAGVLMEGGPGFVRLWIGPGARIVDNIAETDGGGVWCWNLGSVEMVDSTVSSNEAGRDGGGVWLGNRCRLTVAASSEQGSALSLNTAGTRFSGAGQGRGGALFYRSNQPFSASGNDIEIGSLAPNAGHTFFVGNTALNSHFEGSAGGAIYLEGQSDRRVPMRIRDTIFVDNRADNNWGAAIGVNRAIDLLVEGRAARCSGAFSFGLCSAFTGHQSTRLTNLIHLDPLDATDAAIQPRLTVRRVRFTDNASLHALIETGSGTPGGLRVDIESSLFDNNNRITQLLALFGDGSLRFSTAINNLMNRDHVFWLGRDKRLDLTGSILWQPGIQLARTAFGSVPGEMVHSGCLLSHTRNQLAVADSVIVEPPQLDANFMPGPASPALDVCNTFVPGDGRDAFGQVRPVDQPGIPNRLGAHDLGAIERPLSALPPEIFADGFE